MGLVLGVFGTVIGVGGGFLLVPVLILLYPNDPPETITSISLAVVFFNTLSGSVAYARMKRIDYRSGLLYATASVPGAVLGAMVTPYVPRRAFDAAFGVVLVVTAAALIWTTAFRPQPHLGRVVRTLSDAGGTHHGPHEPVTGIALSLAAGFVSSLLGIGGGIIHVPALIYVLGFPAHVATATSQFILTFMTLAGSLVHVATGAFAEATRRTFALAVGVLVGAQLGAHLSNRIHGVNIIRGLAVAVGFVGIRILLQVF